MATPDELAPFVLRDVRGLDSGEKKGSGAYGAVYEVSVKGVSCIAKRIHDILVNQEVSRRERESIQQKFRQECVILSKLKHPNVVYFVGVHYGRAPGDLSLVMEKLHTDLAKCLDGAAETQQDIPLSIKLSILLDVSGGLLYLHTLPQAIIHRDLSAGNILLTRHMQAKIADLGVSKLIDLRKAKVHTRAPGTSDYMPPEALQKKPVYDTKLDVFSFGHLMLYTILQELPEVYENVTPEALRRGTAQILKRETSIDKMGKDHVLYPLNIQCLQDKPERRPTTLELNQAVMELSNKHPIDLMGGFHKDDTDVRVLKKVLSESDHKRQELSQELHKMKEKCDQLRQLYHESEQRHVYMLAVNEKLKAQAEQVECMTMEISHSESRVSAQSKEIAALKEQIGKKDDEIAALNAQAQAYKEDFEYERKDREAAAGRMQDTEADLNYQFHERGATEQELQSLRRERDALRAELHHMKTVEGDFSAAFQREYDQREELEKKYGALMDRFDLQFRDNDTLKMILSQYNIPLPPQLEATPTPQRLPPSTAADIARARIQPLHDITPRSPNGQQMAASTAYARQQAVPPQQPHPQQYAPMSPQAYQHSEQEAYHQQKLQEAIQQKEQRFLLEQKRQQELALQQQQLQMQGYSDPHMQGQQRPLMLPPKPVPRMQKKKNPESQPCKVLGCYFRGDEELGGLCQDCYAREEIPQYRHLSTSSSTEDTEEPESD